MKHSLITTNTGGRVNQRTKNHSIFFLSFLQSFPCCIVILLAKSESTLRKGTLSYSSLSLLERTCVPCFTENSLLVLLLSHWGCHLGFFCWIYLSSPAFCSKVHDLAISLAQCLLLRLYLLPGVMDLNMLYTQMTFKLVSSALSFPLKYRFIYSNFDYVPVSNRDLKFILYEPKY